VRVPTEFDIRLWDSEGRPLADWFEALVGVAEAWTPASGRWQGLRVEDARLKEVARHREEMSAGELRRRAGELAAPGTRRLTTGVGVRCWRFRDGAPIEGWGRLGLVAWDRAWIAGSGRDLRLEGDGTLWIQDVRPYCATLGDEPEAAVCNARVEDNLEQLTALLHAVIRRLRPRAIKVYSGAGDAVPFNAHLLGFAGPEVAVEDVRFLEELWRGGHPRYNIPPVATSAGSAQLLHLWRSADQRARLHQRLGAAIAQAERVTERIVIDLLASGRLDTWETEPGWLVLDYPHPFNAFLDRFYLELLEAAAPSPDA
jgi:hypothetical protein